MALSTAAALPVDPVRSAGFRMQVRSLSNYILYNRAVSALGQVALSFFLEILRLRVIQDGFTGAN